MRIRVTGEPLSARPFLGLGVQADGYLYDEENRKNGVGPADLEVLERRLRALRPSLARMFCCVNWFNPELDARTYRWDQPDYLNLLRMMRLLEDAGASINLALFQPMKVSLSQYPVLGDAMVDLIAHLREAEGVTSVRWLTLFNEPDGTFPHESPLAQRIFGGRGDTEGRCWDVYAAMNRRVEARLRERGLYPHVKLAVPDCVWGAPMRRERMELAGRDFGGMDVMYSYHNYSPEDRDFYQTCPADYFYEGMAAEASHFRGLVGPAAPMAIWEFNLCGSGFDSHYPGVDRRGVTVTEALDGGPHLCDVIMLGANHGVDGFCLWCLTDMIYCGHARRMMEFGLWRYKWQGWRPKPYSYYYSALCQQFRAGAALLRLEGVQRPINALAARDGDGLAVAVVNTSETPVSVTLQLGREVKGRILRVRPELLPREGDLPLDAWESMEGHDGEVQIALGRWELGVWRT